jgi:hypothetical protein
MNYGLLTGLIKLKRLFYFACILAGSLHPSCPMNDLSQAKIICISVLTAGY